MESDKGITERILAAFRQHLARWHGPDSVTSSMLEDDIGTLAEHGNAHHAPDFIAADGSVPATADIPLGAHKLTGVTNPAADQDAATKKYVDDSVGAHKDEHDPENGGDPLDTAAPNDLYPDNVNAEGSAHEFARADHDHGIDCDTAASIAGVQAAGEGEDNYNFSRADHVHGIAHSIADNALLTVDGAMAEGDFVKVSDGNGLEGQSAANAMVALPAATTGAPGKVELAIASEINTGNDATRANTPDALAGSNFGIRYMQAVVVDFTTDCAVAATGAFWMHIPPGLTGMNLVYCHAEVITAGTTGTMDIEIYNLTDTVDMLSTTLTVDSAETGSDTAATPYVIDGGNDDVATNDVIRIDIDAVHTTPAKGLIVTLGFQLP